MWNELSGIVTSIFLIKFFWGDVIISWPTLYDVIDNVARLVFLLYASFLAINCYINAKYRPNAIKIHTQDI